MSKRESTEYRAFRNCFSVLADGITDPGRLAIQLYSKDLIGPDIRTEAQKQAIAEQVKIEMVLSAVEKQIGISPATKFRVFLDVLQNEPSLQHLAKRLENTQRELSGECALNTPPAMPTPSGPPHIACIQSSNPHHPPTLPLPLAKRPRTDVQPMHSLEHTMYFQPSQQTTNSGGQSSAVDGYSLYLKSVYTREKLPIYDKWPQVKSKKYINLALIEKEDITKPETDRFTKATIRGNIDDIKKSRRAIDIGQIAQLPDGSPPKCILVEGAPGVGKSTFAWKLCCKWGKGKLLQQYQLVVLLRLRDKSVQTAKKISDLFQYHQRQIQQAAVEEIQDAGGKGVLLLFEGYDELPEELRTESSVFLDVIMGRELPEATVLITSRPWASELLHRECRRHISQHIEIEGFTKDNIQTYLESTILDNPSLLANLNRYISCYPHIGSLMYIPLYSAFVVEVYRNSWKYKMEDETPVVPKTMTELYSSLVRDLLLRHLLDHPVHSKKRRRRLRSFDDLPQDVYQQLCELGRIAYEGILHGQQVIFSDLPEDFETLGLMQCVPELYAGEGGAVSYNFLHLTVQEYLAGFHLSQQPVEEQIKHLQKYCKEGLLKDNFSMVLRFLSGISKFSGYPSTVLNTLYIEESDSDNANSDAESGIEHEVQSDVESDNTSDSHSESADDYGGACVIPIDTLHWLFEAQDSDVIAKYLGLSEVRLDRPYLHAVTPFDCFVLGYCVSHSNCTWFINLLECHIGDKGVEMLVQGAVEEETHFTGGISKIDLFNNDVTSEGVGYLLNFPKRLIKKLELLNLNENEFCDTSNLVRLVQAVPHLKGLALNFDTGQEETVPLIKSLTAHNSLELLSLYINGIGMEECQALSELVSSSTPLKWLDISESKILPEALELIISKLHCNTTLVRLDIEKSYFSLQNTSSLASVLRKNRTLAILNLGDCNINIGACWLADALCTNDTLQKLLLWKNSIQVEGAVAFAKMLHKNKSLKQLSLQDNSIGEEGTKKLIESLTRNTTLVKLWLPEMYKSSVASSGVDSRVKWTDNISIHYLTLLKSTYLLS